MNGVEFSALAANLLSAAVILSTMLALVTAVPVPTRPALTIRRFATRRSNCMWVWPHTTTSASTPAKTDVNCDSGVTRVKHSTSFRGVAW